MLYPESGSNDDPIAPDTSYKTENLLGLDILSEPGNWVVVVVSGNVDENGGGVAIDQIDATIADGGELEMTMSSGGYLHITTAWTDTNLTQHHVGSDGQTGYSMITDPVTVTVDIGLDTKWDYHFAEDGTLTVLLPVSDVELDSKFTTLQRNLEMDYTGFALGSIEQGIIEISMDYNRKINSETSVTVNEQTITNATFIESSLTATISGVGIRNNRLIRYLG